MHTTEYKTYATNVEGIFVKKSYDLYGNLHTVNDDPAVIYYNNDATIEEHWYKAGRRHRDCDLPAICRYHSDGVTYSELAWFSNGSVYNRPYDKSNYQLMDTDGVLREERWYELDYEAKLGNIVVEYSSQYDAGYRGVSSKLEYWNREDTGFYHLHRLNDPAIIRYHSNGKIASKDWCINGTYVSFRDGSPTRIYYYDTGAVQARCWIVGDKFDRKNAPALIYYDIDGCVALEAYDVNYNMPITIIYSEDGNILETYPISALHIRGGTYFTRYHKDLDAMLEDIYKLNYHHELQGYYV